MPRLGRATPSVSKQGSLRTAPTRIEREKEEGVKEADGDDEGGEWLVSL